MLGRAGRLGMPALVQRTIRWFGPAGVALAVAVAAAGCGSSSSGGSDQGLTLYNAQHEQTTNALISGVHQADRDRRARQERRRGRAHGPDRAGGQPLAGGRLLHRELQLAPAARRPRACWPRSSPRRSPRCRPATARPTATGSGSPAASACSSTTRPRSPPRSCRHRCCSWPIRSTRASSSSRPPRPTSGRSSPRSITTEGQAPRPGLAPGPQGQRGLTGDSAPDNETVVSDVNQGNAEMGLINHYYYYRLRAEVGAGSVHARLAYFAPRDPGYVEDISGAGSAEVHPAPGGGAEVPGVPDGRRRPAHARRTATASSTRWRPGGRRQPGAAAARERCNPTRSRPPSSGPGWTPRRCSSRPA